MRHRIGHALGIAAVLALVACYGAILRGYAQPTAVVIAEPSDALVEALARVCAAEAGWDTSTGDCAAIVPLLERRASLLGVDTLTMTRRYANAHFDRRRTDARRWTAYLELAAREPRGWPRDLDWNRFRDRWLAIVEHVRAVLRAEVADPCGEARPDHWGGPMDDARARRAGLRRVDCGPTRNRFWCVPRRRGGGPTS